VRQPADDRALYLRQLRATVANTFLPELASPAAIDAAGLVDRILAECIVEEEWAESLSTQYGAAFEALLHPVPEDATIPVSPERFDDLRRQAALTVSQLADSDATEDQEMCRALVVVERQFLERVDELRKVVLDEGLDHESAPSSTECSVTSEQLGSYLRTKFPGSPDLAVAALRVIPGGRSKETILVTLTGTTELPPEVIVRKDRPVGILETRAIDEFGIVEAVYLYGGVPVARPYFADELDKSMGGGTLLVVARVAGTKAGEYFPDLGAPTEHQHALGLQFAAALAHLHQVPLASLTSTGLDIDAVVTEGTISAAVEGMSARITELSGPPIAAVPLARQWLLDHVTDVLPAGGLCLLQADVGLHNMLIDGDRLSALVDWEAATIGPPARELAAAWPAATALMPWPEFVDAYRAAGGPAEATDERAVAYYRLFFALGACMSSRTGGHLFRTGAKRDLLTAHSGLDSHFRAQRNLARALAAAVQS
jgi:aminoglycoside phosphotransferase (APT) family kinase protein